MKKQSTKQYIPSNRSSIFSGILFILAGLFLMLIFIDFNPEDSLYFNTRPSEEVSHFLGKAGVNISAFFFYFLGRGAYVLTFFFIYSGYVLLKKITPIYKSGLILLSFSTIISSAGFFSRLNNEVIYKGGGLFGKNIVTGLTRQLKPGLILIIFSGLFIGITLYLLMKPVKVISYLFSGLTHRLKGKNNVKKRDERPVSVNDIQDARDFVKDEPDERKKNIRRKKPPLIRKIYLNKDESLIEQGPVIYRVNNEEEMITAEPNLEDDNGQYLLPANDSGKKSSPHHSQQKHFLPDASLLKRSKSINRREREKESLKKAGELERTLGEFGIEAKVTAIIRGPVITRYELQPAPGVKLSRIVNLSDNIALSLSANGVRIEAPIPGRSTVGIEIPNEDREIVTFGDIVDKAGEGGELPLILGKDISGKVIVSDLSEMPHLLIAGATGSGKSVCVNALIMSLLFHKRADEVRFVMIDPKMVELKIYNGIPHLLTEVVTDPREASKVLRWIIYEMENRYRLLDEQFVRDIKGYNKKSKEKMPYIIVIIDEFANLMAISQKEIEDAVVRLAAMSRAVGIHLIMATQRPSVDVITGLIKANFPYRISFQVASKTDSRTILDYIGAEKLLGRGDMLFSPAGSMNIKRIQGALIIEDEVLRIVSDLRKNSSTDYVEDILSFEKVKGYSIEDDDPIFDESVEIVLKTKRASASFLQRRLKIGYNRAARLIELMEEKGIIGPPNGSKPREIYVDEVD